MPDSELTRDSGSAGATPRRLLAATASGLALLFSVGVVTGVAAATIERGELKPLGMVSLVAAACVSLFAIFVLKRTLPHLIDRQASPRVGRARTMVVLSGAVGGVLGMFLVLGTIGGGRDPGDAVQALSSAPVPAWVALVAIAVWLGLVPLLTWNWHRNIDEHEAEAYRDGALAGIYTYFAIVPTWWMAWRGGLTPEPQEMPVFLVVVGVVGLVWAWRRFR